MTKPFIILAFLLVPISCGSSSSCADDFSVDLSQNVRRMQSWLGAGPKAEGWRRYLDIHRLESHAVRGWNADPAVLDQILQRFESDIPGLEHPIFAGVRSALRSHVANLQSMATIDIDAAIQQADGQYRAITNEEVTAQRDRLLHELRLLKKYYRRSMSDVDFATVDQELGFSDLIVAVEAMSFPILPQGDDKKEEADTINKQRLDDRRLLQASLDKISDATFKRNDSYLPIVKRQLEKLLLMYGFYDSSRAESTYKQLIDGLKDQYASINDPSKRADHGALGLTLGRLDCAGQQTALIGAIKSRHAGPNFEAVIDENFVRQIARRPVNATDPVDEIILGRQIYGVGTTIGQVDVDFVADNDQAHISLHLLGENNANSYTSQGRITAYSSSNTQVEARRSILVNAGGIHEYQAYVAANLASSFKGTSSIRLVDRIANKQYLKDKHASEAIGARRAEQKLHRQFTEQTSQAIESGKEQFAKLAEKSGEQSGNVPPTFISTSGDQLRLTSLKMDTFQFGSSLPPNQYATKCDVVVRIHESMLSNYLEPVFAGKSFSNADFADRAEELFGEKPKGYDPEADEDWSITFPLSRPIEIIFEENQIGISAVGRRFTRGTQRPINEPMSINATFGFFRENGKLQLKPVEEIKVEFVNPGTKPIQMNTFQSFLQDLLNKNLEESGEEGKGALDIDLAPNLIPAEKLEFVKDKDAVNDYQLVLLTAEKGWLTVGWRYAPFTGGVRILRVPETPAITDVVALPVQ